MSVRMETGSFEATNVSLKMLMENAYDVRDDLIFGGPGWVGSSHFDIKAKVVDRDEAALKKLNDQQTRMMLQVALEDRFHLKVHKETKELPVYDLVLVKSGPKFKDSPPEDTSETKDKKSEGLGPGSMMINDGVLTSNAVPLDSLTAVLSHQLNRTVINKTGLTGKYDLNLTWAPEGPREDDGKSDTTLPSIFTALQEQLGLKLQPAKGPVETLVVDHVEMPSEN